MICADIYSQENDVANFFTPASKKEPEKTTWRVVNDSLLMARHASAEINKTNILKKRRRIAGFDFVRAATTAVYSCVNGLT